VFDINQLQELGALVLALLLIAGATEFRSYKRLSFFFLILTLVIIIFVYIILQPQKGVVRRWIGESLDFLVASLILGFFIGSLALLYKQKFWPTILFGVVIPLLIQFTEKIYHKISYNELDLTYIFNSKEDLMGEGWNAIPLTIAGILFMYSIFYHKWYKLVYLSCWTLVMVIMIFPLHVMILDGWVDVAVQNHMITEDTKYSIDNGLLQITLLYTIGSSFLLFLPQLINKIFNVIIKRYYNNLLNNPE